MAILHKQERVACCLPLDVSPLYVTVQIAPVWLHIEAENVSIQVADNRSCIICTWHIPAGRKCPVFERIY